MTKRIFIVVACMSLALTSCIFSSSPKKKTPTPANTFPDYQHISGYVKGHWTKDHNPHALTSVTEIRPGDTLVIESGVQIEGPWDIETDSGSFLIVKGTADDPVFINVRSAIHAASRGTPNYGGGGFSIAGHAKLSHVISPKGFLFSQFDTASSLEIDHATFIHGSNGFQFFDSAGNPGVQHVHISIRNSIFAVPITSLLNDGPVLLYTKDGLADTSLWTVENNCFYREGMDSGTIDPGYSLSTKQGVFTAPTWPGNGNVAALPDFVSYTIAYKDTVLWHRSDSVLITQVYDLHVKTGTPCANMGAYAP